jgi:hypothetical protein
LADVPVDHAERCLAHTIGGVRGVYDVYEYMPEKRSSARSTLMSTPKPVFSGSLFLRLDEATTHARLASGWRARLYRKGVEPSGSLQKVSDQILILLFWIYPGTRRAFLHLS